MAEDNVLAGGIETLYAMKESLLELEGYKEKSLELAKEEEQLERAILAKEKAIEDEINEVTKKRKDEIELSFEEQINKIKTRIKKVKNKKDKLKDSKISKRIEIETAELIEERRQLKEEMKSIFRIHHISRLHNNEFYYSIFMPQGLRDLLVIVITILICFLFLPVGIYHFLLPQKFIWIVLTYFITVIVFGGIYFRINHVTKEKNQAGAKKLKDVRKRLLQNARRIKAIEKSIRKDKDESVYGLDKYNKEIAQLESEFINITEEKKTALADFEANTKLIISKEIKERQKIELDELKRTYDKVYEEQRNAEEKVTKYSLDISRNYESFVGKENMSIVKIERLIEIMETGEVKKISEAIAVSGNSDDLIDKQ